MSGVIVPIWSAIKRALCYVKKYSCTWCKLLSLLQHPAHSANLFAWGEVYTKGCLCVSLCICAPGAFPGSGFCRWSGSRRLWCACSRHPSGERVCVSQGAWLGRYDFPMTEQHNSRLDFSHKAIGIILWFTNKALRTPTLQRAWVKLRSGGG